ncbi:MAG: L-aspartate oxidase [Vampirovibrionales bacterium]|nr:L-aspartate oxidase [Vampirovibrionales bacterium]
MTTDASPENKDALKTAYLKTTALVIGTGISGLFTALKLAEHNIQTVLITKAGLDENNSRYAQGGIAAVLPQNAEDSLDLHVQDTIKAGGGLTDELAVRSILGEGFEAIEDLLSFGVDFDRNADNTLALTKEAAHSVRRIIHAGGDATGASVERALIEKVLQSPLIQAIPDCQAVELMTRSNRCHGARTLLLKEQQELVIEADFVALATGGLGRLYSHTTNPPIATGDGIALAQKAAARLQQLEFIQFHPTAFYADGTLQFLISEALRGEGGILTNCNGDLFAKRYHPDGELAPRDVVTRAIFAEMRMGSKPYVYLDITHLPKETIESRFPTILESCQRFGVDIRKDLIPVAPAAHYVMGGVSVNFETGLSSVDHLYAVGETAHTGLHGANRLASNSLLECVVLARRVANDIAQKATLAENAKDKSKKKSQSIAFSEKAYRFEKNPLIQERLYQLHELMWEHVGIVRSDTGLAIAIQQLEKMNEESKKEKFGLCVPDGVEYKNQLRVAKIIAQAALSRKESLGAHYRIDSPVREIHSPLLDAALDYSPATLPS